MDRRYVGCWKGAENIFSDRVEVTVTSTSGTGPGTGPGSGPGGGPTAPGGGGGPTAPGGGGGPSPGNPLTARNNFITVTACLRACQQRDGKYRFIGIIQASIFPLIQLNFVD